MHGVLRGRYVGPGRGTLVARDAAPRRACRRLRDAGYTLEGVSNQIGSHIWFYDWRRRGTPPPGLCLDISGEDVEVRLQMKYLGLTIDSQWTFGPHFRLLVPKVTTAANALCGLLPNIDWVEVGVRWLYEGVVRPWVLYGTSVWARDLMTSRRSLLLLRRLHRTTAIKIVRGYRTISYASAVLPNWEAYRDRGRLPLSFRITQMLAEHGVFEEYQEIGREVTNTCYHCGECEDAA